MLTKNCASLTAISLALLLGACSTTPEADKAPGAAEAPPPGAVTTPGGGQKPAGGTNLTSRGANPADALKDPNNILSKRSVWFEYDKYDIKPEYKGVVEAHAKYLRDNPGAKMLIQGNADERGSREYNVGLGQRRSDTVKRALVLLGAREGQIESVSLGEEKPVCTEHAEGCWAKNRRDDMLYNGEY